MSLKKIHKLKELYENGDIPTLSEHEVYPNLKKSSRERYLYFTLPPCLNFQRSSPAMWKAALATWEDIDTQYLFFPEKVATQKRSVIQRDLTKHKLALQKNRHTDIWIAICNTLHKHHKSDPRSLLKSCDHDVIKILSLLRTENKKDFPYLSGPKMSNYWLYILSQYTDVVFTHMEEISIIPDTHVLQATAELGLSNGKVTPEKAEAIWKETLKGSGIAPVEMHPVLWNWSRNNFKPSVA